MTMLLAEGPGTRRHTPSTALVMRAMREFDELPALRITLDQAMRLLTLDRETCREVLDLLVAEGFIDHDRNGHYFKPGHHAR